jgi:hypothetical protein
MNISAKRGVFVWRPKGCYAKVDGSNPSAQTINISAKRGVFVWCPKGCCAKVDGFLRWRSGQANPYA